MKLLIQLTLITLIVVSCKENNAYIQPEEKSSYEITSQEFQDSIIKEHLENRASKMELYSHERQAELDKGLAKDSTIAYLWQQKAMPLYKQGKYELGRVYLDKAVKFDRNNEWQEYRAFMTCIFAKRYKDAIADFEECMSKNGDSYVMDHSYSFYIALCKIQLNEFAEAEELLQKEVDRQTQEQGEEWVHHLDLFYLGIARYEQGKYPEAIDAFDRALERYPKFADALYYKCKSEARQDNMDEAKRLYKEAREYGLQGHTINEDNAAYERYPYQVRWR